MELPDNIKNLISKMLEGDRLALSRLISVVESRKYSTTKILKEINPHTGNSYLIGITGPPGAGKSTLISCIVKSYSNQGKKIGILAVDPTSPFSGGAVLGDRIRMQEHTQDKNVFIRSLGSRGSHGGMSRSTSELIKIYDAFGMELIIIETVGVGQTELDVIGIADTVIVVLVPEAGDAIQTMKAGLMEIADIFVVNKADREGANNLSRDIHTMIGKNQYSGSWDIPVLNTVATQGTGVGELLCEIEKHREHQIKNHILEQKHEKKREYEFVHTLRELFEDKISREIKNPEFSELILKVRKGDLDPYEGAEQLFNNLNIELIKQKQ
jgi:LAO/AO transport system kinase